MEKKTKNPNPSGLGTRRSGLSWWISKTPSLSTDQDWRGWHVTVGGCCYFRQCNITHDGKLWVPLCVPQVESLVERVIVFLLSQVVERHPAEGSLFSLHPRTESCKLLWRDGQAVGFYTVKHKGETKGRGERSAMPFWPMLRVFSPGDYFALALITCWFLL